MCEHDDAERTPESEEALAVAVRRWNALDNPWTAQGADRRELRHAVMAARMQGACWGEIGAAVGVEKDALKALFGCMPRYGRKSEEHGGGHGGHGSGGGCGGGGNGGNGDGGNGDGGHEHSPEDGEPAGRTHRLEIPVRP
ncbi:MAG: hypothetical protein ACQERF_02235 [Actinomycetota bacterium]